MPGEGACSVTVCGGTYEPSRASGGKASHTGGPPVTGLAPPRDHGAALEALHAGGLVYHPLSSRSGAICPGVSRQAARPTCAGPPLRGAHPFLRAVYPESKGAAGGAPAGTGDCWPAASVRAAPPERQSTGRIAGPHRTPSSPRYSHATRTPARPVGPTEAAGVGAEGVGAGVTTPPNLRPRAAGAFDSFPRALGPPAPVGCRLQAFNLAWAAITDDAYVLSIVRSGLVVELSEPLPGGVIRMPTPRMPPHVRAGMTAEITALLNKGVIEPMADHPRLCLSPVFLVPKRSGSFRLILNLKRINRYIGSVHFRMETLASILPYLNPGRLDCLHRLKRCVSSRTYSRTVKRLARLYVQRKGLSLQSAALRAQARTPRLHKAGRMRGRIPPPAGSTHLLLPRRLAAGSPLAPTVKAAPGLPVADSTGPGVYYQLGQVEARFRLSARRSSGRL